MIRLLLVLTFALALIALIAVSPATDTQSRIALLQQAAPTARCQDSIKTDCTTARSVCQDIASMASAYCRATGGINCTNESNRIYVDCVTGMGCPLNQ